MLAKGRRSVWYLRSGILLPLFWISVGASEGQMRFSTVETEEERFIQLAVAGGQTRIFAEGPIDEGATERLRHFVRSRNIEWAVVYLDSPGGSLLEALQLGRAIRELRFDTRVGSYSDAPSAEPSATCASACTYAFAGGHNRFFSEYGGRLGIHQFYDAADNVGDIGDTQVVSAVLISYLQEMGINASAFARAAEARSHQMVWLSPQEAQQFGLANNGTQPTTSTIRLTGGQPYLRLEQSHHDVTARVILGCVAGRHLLAAGIVTTPERSRELHSYAVRNYLEVDSEKLLAFEGTTGTKVEGSVLWLERELDSGTLNLLRRASLLSFWLDSPGAMRWGATLDLSTVQEDISYYLENCS